VPCTLVNQLSLPKTICAVVLLPGAAAFTAGHSRRIAVMSSYTSVLVAPQPSLSPPRFTVPLDTNSMFEPMAAIWSCTCLLAPCPTPTIAITAPTPMMIPSMVSPERSLLRPSARTAILTMETKSITRSVLQRRHGLHHLCRPRPIRHRVVPPDLSVAKHDRALRILRDVGFMRHQHHRQSFVVQRLENVHDLHRR